MGGFDRRTVIKAGAAVGAALFVPRPLQAAEPHTRVFVVDRRFAASAAAALERSRLGAVVIDPREEDLGISWRQRIPGLLGRGGGVVEGMTLWSDLLICQTFARGHGLALVRPPRPVPGGLADGLQLWTLAEPGPGTKGLGQGSMAS